ncbi:hypothetical protein C8Q74DRAFT_1269223 [Fomes fomentarius]|nr:hypothetical protein C8Q74DRAFT_1269223 [Fomes fomentarius]
MPFDPGTAVPFPLDFGSSFAEEFLLHPDFRIIAGFLLGWVFWSGISYACRSQFFQLIGRIVWNFLRGMRSNPSELSDVEAQAARNVEKQSQRRFSQLSAIHRISNEAALTFTLNLCFAFAGFAEFCSLLVYDRNGETACAFTIAWGSMAAQSARLIGLLMLVLRLNHRGVSNVEFYCLCTALVVGLSFFLSATCFLHIDSDENRWVPTAILSSAGFIVLESYMIVRFLGWDAYKTGFKAMLAKSVNMQVGRGCSLLLLDVLTVVPNAATINQLTQFVPFSIAALIVLGVFNHDVQERYAIPGSRVGVVGSNMPSPQVLNGDNNKDNSFIVFDSPEPPPAPIGRPSERQTLVVPTSAPPRIGDASVFAEHQTRQILPFQVQYAEQLERHLHTGPIVAPIRPKRQRPRVQVVIEDMEPPPSDSKAVPSIIGSDIIRMSSAATSDSKKQWSPGSNPTPTDYTVSRSGSSSVATPTTTIRTPTTTRDSTLSMLAPSHTRSVSSGSRMILSAASSRQPSRRKIRSPGDTTSKLPWRSAPRTSFASAKTFGAREELPIVVEGQSSSGSRRTSRGSAITKHTVISRPHSLRGSGSTSPQRSRFGKQLPSLPSDSRPSSSRHLAVPESRRSTVGLPASPASFKSIRPSSEYIVRTPTTPKVPTPELPSPALPTSTLPMPSSPPSGAYERAQGTGRLRGPRSPPISSSVPNLVSGWPVSELGLREERRRSISYPALPPLTLGSASLQHVASIRR